MHPGKPEPAARQKRRTSMDAWNAGSMNSAGLAVSLPCYSIVGLRPPQGTGRSPLTAGAHSEAVGF